MMTEKVIVVLLIVAMLLSVVSIGVTLSLNVKKVPTTGQTFADEAEESPGNVQLIVENTNLGDE